jgi:hypothetical protein
MSINQNSAGTSAPAVAPSRSRLVLYFLVLLAVPGFFYLPPFFLVQMPSYAKWSRVPDFPLLDFSFKSAGQNADVVIFGDSSANHGIDPSLMSAALGVKVLDMPNGLGGLLVVNDLSLRRYMAADKPPQLIIFYFAPWNLDYGHDDIRTDPLYNGMEMLVRYGTAGEIFAFVKAHPAYAIQFPLMFYRANINPQMFHQKLYREQARQVVATNGHGDTIGTLHYDSGCVIPTALIGRMRYDWVRRMAETYSTPQTKVLVYVAPIPGCSNAQAAVDHARAVLPLAPPKTMPAPLFLDDQYYIHLYADGVPLATQNLIDAARPLLAAPKP